MAEIEPQPSPSNGNEENDEPEAEEQRQEPSSGGGCNFDRGQPAKRYGDIDVADRLTFPRGNKVDLVYANTPKPYGLVPLTFLPIWPELSTDTKIPILPAPKDIFEISRGEVGEALYRPPPDFTTTDPLNKEKVITAPYTALHDPFAKTVFENPANLEFLKKMKLVAPDGQVLCSTKDFNDYRRYLNKRLFQADLNATYAKMDNMVALQKKQLQEIRKDVSKREGKLFKIEQTQLRAKQMNAEKMSELRKRFLLKNAYTDFRAQAHQQMLVEERTNRMLIGIAKENRIQTKVQMVREEQEERRKFLVRKIQENERRTADYRQSEKCRKAKEREEFLFDWLSVRCEAQKQQIERAAETKKTVTATLKRNAMKRQMKVDAHRAGMVDRMIARAAEEERIWALVRKFFYRWLDNVRKRKARRPDEFHRSFWEIRAEVEAAVVHLRQESGYEKFDDFIMNIVKLKRDIMAEMESEEQAEAAAALGWAKHEAEEAEAQSQNVAEGDNVAKSDNVAESDQGQGQVEAGGQPGSNVAEPSEVPVVASVLPPEPTPTEEDEED